MALAHKVTHTATLVVGMLLQLPTDDERRRVMRFVTEVLQEGEQPKKEA